MQYVRYAEAVPRDIIRLRDAGAPVYVPVGSLEWHDTHAPLGTDGFIAEGLCLRLAELTGGAVMPPLYWGLSLADAVKPPYIWQAAHGSLSLGQPDVWEAFMRAQISALLEDGWRIVVLLAGHVGGTETKILQRLTAEHAQPRQPQAVFLNPYHHTAGDHAGYFETNMLLGLRPESVQPAASEGNPWARAPADAANARDGGQMVRESVAGMLELVQAACIRANPLLTPPCAMPQDAAMPAQWSARWIAPAEPAHENFYFLARGAFQIKALPAAARLHITADTRYTVWLNGRRVGCGPARGSHRRYFVDTYDVTPALQPGKNWLAMAVHSPVSSTFNAVPHAPGLLAEIPGLIATSEQWQARIDPAHNSSAMIYTKQAGYTEWRDLRAEPPDWTTGGDGADGWGAARELALADEFGGRALTARPIADLTWTERLPARMVEMGRVPRLDAARLEHPDFAAHMQSEMHFAGRGDDFETMDALIWGSGMAIIKPAPRDVGAYVIIDFGREIAGHLLLDLEAPAGMVVDIGYDEDTDQGRLMVLRANVYRFADRLVTRAGRQNVSLQMQTRGFRYVQLTFRQFDEPVKLYAVRAVERVNAQPIAATWSCAGDTALNRLWKTCANTVRLCASDTFVDCIWREQAFWLPDCAVITGYYLGLTGDKQFPAHNLRLAADGIRPDGLIPNVYPAHPVKSFPVMPALWALTMADYHLYTGDAALIRELWPTLENALAWYDAKRDSDGLVPDQPDMWNFIDWGYNNAGVALAGKTAILNILIAAGYKQAAGLAAAMGRPDQSDAWSARARAAVQSVNAALWDEARGCYRDCTQPGGAPTASQHPLAVGLAFNLFEAPQRAQAAARLLDKDLIQAELFFQHFVLLALAEQGRVADGLGEIHKLYDNMIASDTDTIWECRAGRAEFQNCGSLCHAFSCAPLRFLQENILGVRPLKPGFAEFAVHPNHAGLWGAWGIVPTPHGLVRVKWTCANQAPLKLEVEVPAGTTARLTDGRQLDPGRHTI